jgi:phosphatidylinositol kinase/protein kinase (PI-3  family)
MGGPRSVTFRLFRAACVKAFIAARESMDRIILLVEMMIVENENLPCFKAGMETITSLRQRFRPELSNSKVKDFVHELIGNNIMIILCSLFELSF